MPRFALFPALLLVFTLTACGEGAETPAVTDENPTGVVGATSAGPSEVRLEDGVQVVDVTVGTGGYVPATITLQADVPARLVFTRQVEGECPSQVRIPAFGVEATDLPMHEPTAVTFTPDETGTFTFVCGMDMMKGTLVVES